jgi:hypothetical protein
MCANDCHHPDSVRRKKIRVYLLENPNNRILLQKIPAHARVDQPACGQN